MPAAQTIQTTRSGSSLGAARVCPRATHRKGARRQVVYLGPMGKRNARNGHSVRRGASHESARRHVTAALRCDTRAATIAEIAADEPSAR